MSYKSIYQNGIIVWLYLEMTLDAGLDKIPINNIIKLEF